METGVLTFLPENHHVSCGLATQPLSASTVFWPGRQVEIQKRVTAYSKSLYGPKCDQWEERKLPKHRKPASRAALRKASQEKKPGSRLVLGVARQMAEGLSPEGAEQLVREIVAYNVTKIFHAPVSWPDKSDDSWVRIQGDTPEYSATLTGELKHYLENSTKLGQFANDPGLRETVEDVEKRAGTKSTYLVVEEQGQITDCTMDQGECWQGPDGGRDGVLIFKTSGGAWPTFSEQVERDSALLAAMRTMTGAPHPFELHARSVCYITDQGEPAHPLTMEINVAYGGLRSTKPLARGMVAEWANRLGENAESLRKASVDPAINELLAAIRLDKAKDEEHFRLWYLRLWQALVDVGLHCELQAVKDHLKGLKAQQRWQDLTEHRVAIAHWWTERVDYEKVADLHRLAVEVADYIVTVSRESTAATCRTCD